jgi:FtsP/CotA-like multicopper oxidase with cupredoxin domain
MVRPSLRPPLTPFVDALPLPRRILAGQHDGELTVPIRAATHRFHRDLPTSRVWAYDGRVPGPTIEAERGQPVRVHWRNQIDQPYPVASTLAPTETDADGVPVQCLPGLSGGVPDPHAAALGGYTVVHLHGTVTAAPYDGWAENLFAPGQHAVSDYPMDQRAALLWYHDHVMGVTQLTVYAGLAGLWIVREERERELDLPEGPPFEVPLLLQDRNFGQGGDGQLTGELVHKTDPGTMEAFAPFTVVNGRCGRSWTSSPRPTGCACSTAPTLAPSGSCSCATATLSWSGSPRSGPTAACCPHPLPCQPTGLRSPQLSGPTCWWTAPTWSQAASSPWSTPPAPPSTAWPPTSPLPPAPTSAAQCGGPSRWSSRSSRTRRTC